MADSASGACYPAQLELVELHGTGWKGATPAYSGSAEPLWAYILYYRERGGYGETLTRSLLTGINAAGDVYSDRARDGRDVHHGDFGFRCARAPWDNQHGYVRRAGDGLRRRKGASGSAWLVTPAPEPRHPTMRDLAEWAARGNAPVEELFSEMSGPYASEGITAAREAELVAAIPNGLVGLGTWY